MQKLTKYFYNSEADTLVIVEIENGEATNVLELSDPLTVEESEDEEIEEDEEPESPKPAKEKKSQHSGSGRSAWPVKSCCGSKGPRHKKGCPGAGGSHGDVFVDKILRMMDQGMTEGEIYDEMRHSVTDQQFREKLEIAKKER